MKAYIAFDIGGTQIKYGIVSEIGTVLKHKTVPTEIHLGGEQIIQKLILLSKKLMGEHTISGIGISTAGIVNIHKGIVTGGVEHIGKKSFMQKKLYIEKRWYISEERKELV